MKKIISCSIALFIIFFAFTRESKAQADMGKGDVLFNVGFGTGYYYTNGGGVPLLLSLEFGIADHLSLGPYLGYTSWRHSWSGNYYRYTFLDIGVKASYHFSPLFEIRDEKLDIYGGVFIGYVSSSYTTDASVAYNDVYASVLRPGIHAGVRYYFTPKLGGYAELGYGIAPLQLGLTLKVK